MSKPRVLILGGLGFVGKELVKYLVQKDLASKIRVVDKIMVSMAGLTKEEEALYEKVESIQANLTREDSAAKAFTDADGEYDIVINLAGETKLSQSSEVYAEGVTKVSVTVGKEALKHKIQKFIEVSTADVYEPSDKPAKEDSKVKPWTGIGTAKEKAETELRNMKGLPLIVVRPAIIYGPGDIRGLSPRLCIAAVYKKTGETLEYPKWFEQQKINTVHVHDAARALWHLSQNGEVGKTYNLADKDNLDQKKLNVILEKVFGIKTDVLGAIKSEAIKLIDPQNLLPEINGEHAPTWSTMLKDAKLEYSPLTPWLDTEAMMQKSLCVDGSSIEATGFTYEKPNVTEEVVKEQINHAVSLGWFPPNFV